LDELLACQMVFDGYLREQQTTVRAQNDKQPVAPNLNGVGDDWLRGRKQGNFDAEFAELVRLHRGEPWIFHCCAGSATNNGFSQRLFRFDDPDATLKTLAHMKGHENAAALREKLLVRNHI